MILTWVAAGLFSRIGPASFDYERRMNKNVTINSDPLCHSAPHAEKGLADREVAMKEQMVFLGLGMIMIVLGLMMPGAYAASGGPVPTAQTITGK